MEGRAKLLLSRGVPGSAGASPSRWCENPFSHPLGGHLFPFVHGSVDEYDLPVEAGATLFVPFVAFVVGN